MNAKLNKLRAELQKNKEKIASCRKRNIQLEQEITELENLDIVGLVRSIGMTPEQLSALLHSSSVPTAHPEGGAEDHA